MSTRSSVISSPNHVTLRYVRIRSSERVRLEKRAQDNYNPRDVNHKDYNDNDLISNTQQSTKLSPFATEIWSFWDILRISRGRGDSFSGNIYEKQPNRNEVLEHQHVFYP